PFNLKTLARRIKTAGFKSFFKFIVNPRMEVRTTGLHFVDVKEYYALLTAEKREQYRKDIYSGKIFSYIMSISDEVFLTKILADIGLEHSRMGLQHNPVDMLDFNEPERFEFRPHHGIHL